MNKNAEPVMVAGESPLGQEVFNYIQDISNSEKLPVHFAWDGDEVLIKP
jgi:hypothetical protein